MLFPAIELEIQTDKHGFKQRPIESWSPVAAKPEKQYR